MNKIELQWKEFNINLNMVQTHIKTLDINCCGLQAARTLEVWSTETPSEETTQAIKDYWESLTSESAEATSHFSQADLKAAMEACRAEAATKTFNTLSAQQKKMLFNSPLSDADNAAILAAFGA